MGLDDLLAALPDLRDPVVVVAFEGWNDAGEAATGALDHLLDLWESERIGALDPEEYYDFQVNRPEATFDEAGNRDIEWPSTEVYVSRAPWSRSLVLLRGVEPNNRWRAFTEEVLTVFREVDAQLVITLGAMLAETPHTRPIPVNGTGSTPALNSRYGFEASTYEGPTGILGVLTAACTHVGIPVVSLWAAVPHYYAQPPSPKGALALVGALENVLDVEIPVADLPEASSAWEADVEALADDNDDIRSYVQQLETSHDAQAPQLATGDAIAQEFERYLRRRDNR